MGLDPAQQQRTSNAEGAMLLESITLLGLCERWTDANLDGITASRPNEPETSGQQQLEKLSQESKTNRARVRGVS